MIGILPLIIKKTRPIYNRAGQKCGNNGPGGAGNRAGRLHAPRAFWRAPFSLRSNVAPAKTPAGIQRMFLRPPLGLPFSSWRQLRAKMRTISSTS